MKQRRKWFLAGILFLCMAGIACKKKGYEGGRAVQDVCTVYDGKNTCAYTLDEEGNLYSFEHIMRQEDGGIEIYLKKQNKDGGLVFSRPFDSEKFSTMDEALAIKDGQLYFTVQGFDGAGICAFLYLYDLDTEEISFLQSFRCFEQVDRILVNESRVYLLGKNRFGVSGTSNSYSYNGEKIVWYSLNTKETFELGFAEPINMALTQDGTPVFYVHEEDGFYLLSYDEKTDAVKLLAKTTEYRMNSFTLCNHSESILYHSERGLVLSDLSELGVESELYPGTVFWDNGLCCVNGRVACRLFQGGIVQFPLDEVKKETETIRYLSVGFEAETPYGCGYKIERTNFSENEANKFAVKLLARDKDFDLCLVDTRDAFSYNLKENGIFYPLNDVFGVQEYLDACFPYVREAATGEDGTIWMLPIQVNIPGFVVNADNVEQYGFFNHMTFEEYFRVLAALTDEEQQLIDIPWVAFLHDFFRQYFVRNKSADTMYFRDMMKQFSALVEIHKKLYEQNTQVNTNKENIYHYVVDAATYHYVYITQFCENKVVYSSPQITAGGKNTGTCLFLAVNPESDRLDATLRYLSDWITYTMKKSDKPLFFADRMVGEDAYEMSLYELYQNGEIAFTIDEVVYEGYGNVFSDFSKLDAYIKETDRKLKIYLNE